MATQLITKGSDSIAAFLFIVPDNQIRKYNQYSKSLSRGLLQ
jgi:hypothetical protein